MIVGSSASGIKMGWRKKEALCSVRPCAVPSVARHRNFFRHYLGRKTQCGDVAIFM